MSELRVLLATRTMAHGGGAERLVFDIFQELKQRENIKVKLVSFQHSSIFNLPNIDHFEKALAADKDFKICNYKINFSLTRKNEIDVTEYQQLVEEFKPHIIHSHMFIAELVTRANIHPGVKYFTHCHDNMVQLEKFSAQTPLSKNKLTNYYERNWILKKYTACNNQFVAISNDTKQYFENVLPKKLKKNIHLLYNAIDFKRLNAVNHQRKLDTIKIVNTGNFLVKKNQIFLVEVMRCLKNRKANVSLTFLGGGDEMQNVKNKTAEYGLTDFITFAGNVNNVEEHLKTANLYVHSAKYEPFGLVLLEAMAAGLPVIALDGKGNRDLVKDHVNGFFIEEQNAELFAEKIIALMGNENKYREMSKNAVEFSSGFDMVNYTNKLLKIYEGN